jgi:DNA-binding response OmpR family regulator
MERCLRILILDDHPGTAETVRDLLASTGHAVEVAVTALEALKMGTSTRPDIVFLDHQDADEVCRRIREQQWGERIPLVSVTGRHGEASRHEETEAGCDLYLIRRLTFQELTNVIDDVLDSAVAEVAH